MENKKRREGEGEEEEEKGREGRREKTIQKERRERILYRK